MIQNILLGSLIIALLWLLFYMWNNNLFKFDETIVRIENQQDQDRVFGVNERQRDKEFLIATMNGYAFKGQVEVLIDAHEEDKKAMTSKIEALEKRIWCLENPPKWKKGDKIGDVVVTEVECNELSDADKSFLDFVAKSTCTPSPCKYTWTYHGIYKSTGEKVTFANAYEADRLNKKRK